MQEVTHFILQNNVRCIHVAQPLCPGASFEGGWGAVAPPPQGKRKKERKKEREKEKRQKERREL